MSKKEFEIWLKQPEIKKIFKNLQNIIPSLPKDVDIDELELLRHVMEYMLELQSQLTENLPPATKMWTDAKFCDSLDICYN